MGADRRVDCRWRANLWAVLNGRLRRKYMKKLSFVHWIGKKEIEPKLQLKFTTLITSSYYKHYSKIAVADFCFGSKKFYFAVHFGNRGLV